MDPRLQIALLVCGTLIAIAGILRPAVARAAPGLGADVARTVTDGAGAIGAAATGNAGAILAAVVSVGEDMTRLAADVAAIKAAPVPGLPAGSVVLHPDTHPVIAARVTQAYADGAAVVARLVGPTLGAGPPALPGNAPTVIGAKGGA